MMNQVGRFARRHGRWLLAAAVVLTIPCLFMLRGLTLETDLVSMFSADDPAIRDYRYFSDNFGISDVLVIVVRGDADRLAGDVATLSEWLRKSGLFTRVEYHMAPEAPQRAAVLAFPREPSMNQSFCIDMLDRVKAFLRENGIRAELAGSPATVAESTDSLRQDMVRTGIIASVLILGVLIVSFGDPLFPLVAAVPLGIGIIWCMAFAEGVFDEITFVTAALPTTLLGIGVDYALHLRAVQPEFAGEHGPELWGRVCERVGPPLLVGVLTSVAAFLSLLLARLAAIREMGAVGAFGLTGVFVLCVLLVPVLLDWRDRIGLRFPPLPIGWLRGLVHGVVRHRLLVVAGFVLVTVPLLVCALRVEVTVNPAAYANDKLPSLVLAKELAATSGLVAEPILVATPDAEAEGRVVQSIADLVGPGKAFAAADCLTISRMTGRSDYAPERYVGKDGRLCMVLYPGFNPYEGDNTARLRELVDTLRARGGKDVASLSGAPLVFSRMISLIRTDLFRITIGAAAAVLAVLVVLVRRPHMVAAAMLPLAGGVVWMLGVMYLAGQQLTALNVIAMPLVIGLGIDYGVHIVYRLHKGSVETAVATTGRAVLMASATTAAAFATFCLADNKALVGIGLAAATGIVSCLAWSLLFLPALLARKEGGDGTRVEDGECKDPPSPAS